MSALDILEFSLEIPGLYCRIIQNDFKSLHFRKISNLIRFVGNEHVGLSDYIPFLLSLQTANDKIVKEIYLQSGIAGDTLRRSLIV